MRERDYWNTLLVLQLSSVLRLWTIVRATLVQLTLLLHHWTILRIYDATIRQLLVLFYTTVLFHASRFVQLTSLLHHWMILRIYDASVRRLAVLFYTTVRFYASTSHFAFTRLDDSAHLRCYCTPTDSFVLHHCTILRIYDATVRRLTVLFYTTVRFYASTMLLYADRQFCFIPLYVSTHLRFYGSLYIVTAYWTETQGKTDTA